MKSTRNSLLEHKADWKGRDGIKKGHREAQKKKVTLLSKASLASVRWRRNKMESERP